MGQQAIGAGAQVRKVGQIELHQLEGATSGHSRLADRSCRLLSLGEVARGTDTCAPSAARARADSTPNPAETPVIRTRLPLRSMPERTSSIVDVAPKLEAIFFSFIPM
ncbi:hypothetical protein [Ralstonia pseudosolanacearum]|uniref:hypothetical protein n=1 Tax=Ralstonia pseudosolanacearum TaxID=1310165 RepID=UPI00386B6A8E